jgi:hypothetical protein
MARYYPRGIYNIGVWALDWIWQNRQWLFSGAGISILAFLLWIAKNLRASKMPTYAANVAPLKDGLLSPPSSEPVGKLPSSSSPQAEISLGRFTKPTPHEIKAAITSLPPFQRRAATRAYEGLKVRWLTEFSYVQQDGYERGRAERLGNMDEIPWLVTLQYRQQQPYTSEMVSCYGVSPSAYPQLKIMHERTPIVVSGTIRFVGLAIDLIDVVLEFPESDEQ